jgi:hypothetical protein
VFNQINASAMPRITAFHRQDGGVNALIGIRAARNAYVRRPDADAGNVIWQTPTGANITAAKRPTPAQAAIAVATQSTVVAQAATAKIAEASGGQGAKDKLHPGLSVALDLLESSEEGRELLAKIKASDAGIDIWYNDSTGRDYVYMRGFEKDYYDVHDRVWEREHGKTAQPAATVEISDEGRELAAKMSEENSAAAPASMFKFVKANGEEYTAQLSTYDPDNPMFILDEDIFTKPKQSLDIPYDPKDPFYLYGDYTIKSMIRSNPDVGEKAAIKLTGELGRLLSDPNGTLEERTANRAKGLELAKLIAENYIDDPAAKQLFLDRAKEIANTTEMRDKGYDFLYNDDGTTTIIKTDDNLLASWGKPTEKQATATIERVKNSLDMNAVKEDALNILKNIMADFVNSNGNLALPK